MDELLYITIVLYTLTQLLLPILLWPSRKNTGFYQSIPPTLIAYIFGGIFFINNAEKQLGVGVDTEEVYIYILLLGCVSNVISYTIGFYTTNNIKSALKRMLMFLVNNNICSVKKYTTHIALATIILFVISFVGMGFIPALAENPMLAKFMAGEYQDLYKNYAVPFRLALNLSYIAVILLLLSAISKKGKKKIMYMLLLIGIVTCIALTMRRGQILAGIIAFAFSYAAYSRKVVFYSLVSGFILLYMFGSAANAIFLYIMDLGVEPELYDIFRGMPDVSDQLWFLQKWLDDGWEITFGTNIFGGLIPFHSEYNISALTLYVIGATPGETGSGGFRLLTPMIGYISFSWLGVVAVTAMNAYLNGMVLRLTKDFVKNRNREEFIVINTLLIPCSVALTGKIVEGISIDSLTLALVVIMMFVLSNYKIVLFKNKGL